MRGQVWTILIFIIMIGLVAIIMMALTMPLGYVYRVSQDLTPEINESSIQANVTAIQDHIWNMWWMVPTAIIVILVLWAYAHSQRKESMSEYVRM